MTSTSEVQQEELARADDEPTQPAGNGAHRLSNESGPMQGFAKYLYEPEDLAERFHTLTDRWRAQTTHLSDTVAKAMHPAYQDIIGMGRQALPLILEDLKQNGGH
jgi:hypothetical protein